MAPPSPTLSLTKQALRFFLVAAFFLLAVSCGSTTGGAVYWPTDGWRSSPPEEQGMDPKALSRIDYYVKETFPAVKGVLVVRNGHVVFEKYYQGYDRSDYHHVWSVTKSVTSALVGIALKEGHIENLDQRLPEFFPEHFGAGTDPRKRQIAIEDLLTMTNGFRLNTLADPEGFDRIISSEDVVAAAIGQPMYREPGEVFTYNEGDAHLLSAILTKTTRQSALAYAHENLFGPLGIDSDPDASIEADPANLGRFERAGFVWADDGQGNSMGGFGLKLTPRDMAKLGYLYLQDGRWEGRQIVPKGYVQASTHEQVQTDQGTVGYGYLWWTRELEGYQAFYAHGHGGQFIYVIPQLELVAVIVSEEPGRGEIVPMSPDGLIDYAVVPAVEDE
jgi:CubicO group peptidase (beta-lactamase class C family)